MAAKLRAISPNDVTQLVALNNVFATELSLTDIDGFSALIAEAFYAKCTPDLTAFLIAFSPSSNYHSANFRWFKNTTDRFVYIDRVAVAAAAQGAGVAGCLYDDLFAAAAGAGYDRVCCEVNIEPPNPASDRFHRKRGFVEVGRARLAEQGKSVGYFRANLPEALGAISPPARTTTVRQDG